MGDSDEWSMFGSDEEDEEEKEVVDSITNQEMNDEQSNNQNVHSFDSDEEVAKKAKKEWKMNFEKMADACALHLTQDFIRTNRSVSLSDRCFALSCRSSSFSTSSSLVTAGMAYNGMMWLDALSHRIAQRGMKLVFPSDFPEAHEEEGHEMMCDAAALYRSFDSSSDKNSASVKNNEEEQLLLLSDENLEMQKRIRRALIPGGVLILTTHIRGIHDVRKHPPTILTLLSYWTHKNTKSSPAIFSEAVWDIENAFILHHSVLKSNHLGLPNKSTSNSDINDAIYTIVLVKRPCTINTTSCTWKETNRTSTATDMETSLQYERRILADATVARTVAERLSQRKCYKILNDSQPQQNNVDASNTNHTKTNTMPVPTMTKESIKQAVESIQKHGFVVIRDLFQHSTTLKWGKAVLKDFNLAISVLETKHNVDIVNPGKDGKADPLSYREMAMREDLRVDLRDGPSMKSLRKEENLNASISLGITKNHDLDEDSNTNPWVMDNTSTNNNDQKMEQSLRFNPNILEIIRQVFNPTTVAAHDHHEHTHFPLYKGNFGRWNFDGSGPNGTPQPLRVGQVGAVISLPGAADQAIHADTAHLFENIDCLPCHYANIFTLGSRAPTSDGCGIAGTFSMIDHDGNFTGDNDIGGTAFVHGSHSLSVAARLTAEEVEDTKNKYDFGPGVGDSSQVKREKAREEMHMRIIRPSLQLGDVVIFDCRVLHFGLANRASPSTSNCCSSTDRVEDRSTCDIDAVNSRRPMLYVNMTHSWFHDPKNWNDRESIF